MRTKGKRWKGRHEYLKCNKTHPIHDILCMCVPPIRAASFYGSWRTTTMRPLELPPIMMSSLEVGWKHVRLMTEARDSPVTARRSFPLASKISMHRGLLILPQQKMSTVGCHAAWNVVNHRPVWLLCRMLYVGLTVPFLRWGSAMRSNRLAKDVVKRWLPLGEKKELLMDRPVCWVQNGFGALDRA